MRHPNTMGGAAKSRPAARLFLYSGVVTALLALGLFGCSSGDPDPAESSCWRCTRDADCDDGRAATDDRCLASGCCAGSCEDARCIYRGPCHDGDKPSPSGTACDDGAPCTQSDVCDDKGTCAGTPCAGLSAGPCQRWTCQGNKGCVKQSLPLGATCDDGDPCTAHDRCFSGDRCDGDFYPCPKTLGCNRGACDGKGGCVPGKPLAEGTACQAAWGECLSKNARCDGKGTCVTPPEPAGTACTASAECLKASCDGKGKCLETPRSAGTACSANTPACGLARCDGKGACVVRPAPAGTTCTSAGPCATATCNSKGVCVASPRPSGTACTPSSAGSCQSATTGSCDGKGACQPKPLAAGTPCTATTMLCAKTAASCDGKGTCVTQVTSTVAAGTPCNDGDPCSLGETCDGKGACKSANTTTCPASTTCVSYTCDGKGGCTKTINTGKWCGHDLTCDPFRACDATGQCECSVVGCTAYTDGRTCDDGDSTTCLDTCSDGHCNWGSWTCTPTQCQTSSTCDTSSVSGCLVTNRPQGAPCDDGKASTQTDTCDGKGGCVGS